MGVSATSCKERSALMSVYHTLGLDAGCPGIRPTIWRATPLIGSSKPENVDAGLFIDPVYSNCASTWIEVPRVISKKQTAVTVTHNCLAH